MADELDKYFSAAYHVQDSQDWGNTAKGVFVDPYAGPATTMKRKKSVGAHSKCRKVSVTSSRTGANAGTDLMTRPKSFCAFGCTVREVEKVVVKKKKRKKKRRNTEELTKKLMAKWKENGVEDEGLIELFKRVDDIFTEDLEPERVRTNTSTKPSNVGSSRHDFVNDPSSSGTMELNSGAGSGSVKCNPDPALTSSAHDVLKWITLRENYISQLKVLFESLGDNDIDDTVDSKSGQLRMLLVALRKISIRIVSAFETVCLRYNRRSSSSKQEHKVATESVVQMTDYIATMAFSLNWMSDYPNICEGYLFINPLLNPLLSSRRVDGKSALYPGAMVSNGTIGDGESRVPLELTLDAAELKQCDHLGFIMYTLHTSAVNDGEVPDRSAVSADYVVQPPPRQAHDYNSNFSSNNNGGIRRALPLDGSSYMNPAELDNTQNSDFITTSNFSGFRKQVTFDRNVNIYKSDDMKNSSFDVRFATTDMSEMAAGPEFPGAYHGSDDVCCGGDSSRIGGTHQILYSNSTPFITDESPIKYQKPLLETPDPHGHFYQNPYSQSHPQHHHQNEYYRDSGSDDSPRRVKPSLHQQTAVLPEINDDLVVRRAGGRVFGGTGSGHGQQQRPEQGLGSPFGQHSNAHSSQHKYVTDNDVLAERVVEIYKMRVAWNYWRREFNNRMKILPLLDYRRKRNMQKCFNQLQLCLWQNHLFRDLLHRYKMRLKALVFRQGMLVHHQWCGRLKAFYNDVLKRLVGKYFNFLAIFTRDHHVNRRFVAHRRHRFISTCFRCLKTNVILNRYLLQRKLKTSSKLLFGDFFMRQVCFIKWARYREYSKQLDFVDELVENVMLKDALVRWTLQVWPPKPKVSLQQRVSELRQSVERNILLVKNRSVSTIAPLVSDARKVAAHASSALHSSVSQKVDDLVQGIRPRFRKMITNASRVVHPAGRITEEQARAEELRKRRARHASVQVINSDSESDSESNSKSDAP